MQHRWRAARSSIAALTAAAAAAAAVIGVMSTTATAQTRPRASHPARAQQAHAGNVAAKLAETYSKTTGGYVASKLTITRAGMTVYDHKVQSGGSRPSIYGCGSLCMPASRDHAVKIMPLASAASKNVLVQLYTGGAHCCDIDQVFSYHAAGGGSYTRVSHGFGEYGVELKKLNGSWIFQSEDSAFAYAFTDFADSAAPIQLWSFAGGHFTNVTRKHPAKIQTDAGRWWRAYKAQLGHKRATTGLIAAWAADRDELGQSARVAQVLSSQAKAGHLKSGDGKYWPSGQKFVTALQKFLKKEGYLH